MKREEGYYWVEVDVLNEPWVIGYWCGKWWSLPGNELEFEDNDFLQIDENQIKR